MRIISEPIASRGQDWRRSPWKRRCFDYISLRMISFAGEVLAYYWGSSSELVSGELVRAAKRGYLVLRGVSHVSAT